MFNKIKVSHQKGFTLLEILLVIALIAILAGFVITALNPAKRLATARDVQRKSDIETIQKATYQYLIDKNHYPSSLTGISTPTTICDSGANTSPSCPEGTVDLSALVPNYISAVPKEPSATTGAGYQIALSNNSVYVQAPDTELGYTNQPGYTTSTPVIAFIGPVPSGYSVPTVGSGGGGTSTPPTGTNYALSLDSGQQDYVQATLSQTTYSSYTIEGWFKIDSVSGENPALISLCGDDIGCVGGGLGVYSRNQWNGACPYYGYANTDSITFWMPGISGNEPVICSNIIGDGQWHHIAGVWDGSEMRLYLDGVKSSYTGTLSAGSTNVNSVFRLGYQNTNGGCFFSGSIDEIRISNSAVYTGSTFSPSTRLTAGNSTVVLWNLDEGSGITAVNAGGDTSDNGTLYSLSGGTLPLWITR